MAHSRERSYVVFHCRQLIVELYELGGGTAEETSSKVEHLLAEDRYICREKERDVSTQSRNHILANGH